MSDSDLPPWAPHELFRKEVFGLTIRAGETNEMPVVTLECVSFGCRSGPIQMTRQDAAELASELRWAIEEEGRTRRSVFLHHISDEDSFDPGTEAFIRLDPSEILVYADSVAVVLDLGSGDIRPVMGDRLSPKEAAAVKEASAGIDRRGYQPFEIA